MNYQTNLKIKEEPLSPPTPSLSSSDYSGTYSVVCSVPNSSTMDQCETAHSERSPAKRAKSEDVALKNHETKNKLKERVLNKLTKGGRVDLARDLFPEPKKYQLTKEELTRRDKRKKQNREAAKRCREKKKKEQKRVAQDTARITRSNEKLRQSVFLIIQEVREIHDHLLAHLSCGDCRLSACLQDVHKQRLGQVLDQLQSLVQQEQLLQQTCTEIDLAVDNDQEEEINYQSPDNSNSGLELPTSTKDVHMPTCNWNGNVSTYNPSDNLQSWDLENIIPDLPVFPQNALLNSIDDTIDIDQLSCVKKSEDNHHLMDVIPSCLRNFAEDVFNQGQTDGYAFFETRTPVIGNKKKVISRPSLPHMAEHDQELSNVTGLTYPCVSPNLVQPVSTIFQPATCLPATIPTSSSIYGPTRRGTQICDNADLNNNARSRTTPDKTGNDYSFLYAGQCSSENPLNGSGRQQNASSYTSQYFTFDCNDPSFPGLGISGNEPISPFYTQGGNSRL